MTAGRISRLWESIFGLRESGTSLMTEEQLLSNWIPHDHVWGESGPVPRVGPKVEGSGVVTVHDASGAWGYGLEKSVWKADLVIDDSAAPVLLQILRADAEAGFSNSEMKSPVYSSTSDLLVRIIGRERLEIFEGDLHRLPSWIDYDERFFAPCVCCEKLEPTGYAMDGKVHHCDDCWEFECRLHDHCIECGDCEPMGFGLHGICYSCEEAHEEEEERRQEEEERRQEEEKEKEARRKEDQEWKDEFEPEW